MIQKLSPAQLRKHKGISFVGVTTAGLCYDGKGKFLLMKRGPKARDENGRWDMLGGGLKVGLRVEDNLKRELQEELCVQAKKVTPLGYRDVHRMLEDGTQTQWIALDHLILVDPKKVKIGEPGVIDEIDWFTLEDLPSPLHSQFNLFVESYLPVLKKELSGAVTT